MATVEDVMRGAREAMTVKRVFGEPIEHEGIVFVPVASVASGGGGGEGEGSEQGGQPTGTGSGAGFGVKAKPVGAYIMRGDQVEWRPARDVTRLGLAGIALAALVVLMLRSIIGGKG